MSLEADLLVERRRLKSRLGRWRLFALFFLALLIIGGLISVLDLGKFANRQDHIARLSISGMINPDRKDLALVETLIKAKNVRGVILAIDSFGGTTVGGEAYVDVLDRLAKAKPVVATMGNAATSAGYMVALPAKRIFARTTTITGSIGVIFQHTEFSKLMKNVGVSVDLVRSDPLKAAPGPFSPASPEARQVLQDMINESHEWFMGLVVRYRKMDKARVRKLADGRIYSGQTAKVNGLIDAIGGEREALAWLRKTHKLPKSMKVLEWKVQRQQNDFGFGALILRKIAASFGFSQAFPDFMANQGVRQLDGLISVWHPQGMKPN